MKFVLYTLIGSSLLFSCASHKTANNLVNFKNTTAYKGLTRQVANDAAETKIHSISADGRYVALVESVVQDGSGFPDVALRVIDMTSDKFVLDVRIVDQNEGTATSELEERLFKANQEQIRSLGLSAKNVSLAIKSTVKPNKTATETSYPYETVNSEEGTFSFNNKETHKYDVNLMSLPANGVKCYFLRDNDDGNGLQIGFSLKIDGKSVYQDSRYPKSRGCTYNVWLHEIYKIKDNYLVLMRQSREGFEGPDYRTLAVAVKN